MCIQTGKPCLTPVRSFHLLMIQLPEYERRQRIVQSVYPAGSSLQGAFVHCQSGEVLRPVVYPLQQSITLYFVASDKEVLASWHYVVKWFADQQCWGCSCWEGRHLGACRHSAEVEEFIGRM